MLSPDEFVRQAALKQCGAGEPVPLEPWMRNAWLPVPIYDYLFLKQLGITPDA